MGDLKEINFEAILPFWSFYLWPRRKSKIEPKSIINHLGLLDHSLKDYPVFFWGFKRENQIIGVISGMQTSTEFFRSRGLWVHEDFRSLNVGTKLMKAVEQKAIEIECKTLWSMPRCRSWGFYERNGFKIQTKLENYEFSPHYIAFKSLSRES